MGYGISWVRMPPEVDEAERRANEALERRDGTYSELSAAWFHLLADVHGAYFSGSYTWFGRAIRSEMQQRGMLYGGQRDHPPFLMRHVEGCAERDNLACPTCVHNQHVTDDLGPTPERGMPLYKFSSSDSWLVHPEEITAALRAFEASRREMGDYTGDPSDARHWNTWLRFMYCARGFGGFRVH